MNSSGSSTTFCTKLPPSRLIDTVLPETSTLSRAGSPTIE
jgi:hypothetical protein